MSVQVDGAQLEKMSSQETLNELSVDSEKGLDNEGVDRRLLTRFVQESPGPMASCQRKQTDVCWPFRCGAP